MSRTKTYNFKTLYFSDQIRAAMDGVFKCPLTVIEAPMGYGKTTAVKGLLNREEIKLLWLTVHDSYVSSFWGGFSRLFNELNSTCAFSLDQLGLPNDSVSRQEALNIIKNMQLPIKTVIVIDDYHLLHNPDLDSFIILLVKNEIKNLHIVVNTRLALFEDLDELKLKGFAHHITKDSLELSPDEITRYYRLCGISLKADQADQLYSNTEGWISALYLVMLNFIEGGSFTTPNSIYKLLGKAVYEPFSQEIKDFLITMCIFNSFTLEQAAYMWGLPNTRRLIDEITSKNAFVNFDSRTNSYQMHNIFTNFLQEILAEKEAHYRQDLYKKAAQWFLQSGDFIAAMHYFYLCQDFDALLSTIEYARAKIIHSEHKTLLIQYMEDCPDKIKGRHYFALLIYAMRLFSFNERELFAKTCAEFITNIQADQTLDETAKNQLLGEYDLILSFTKYNNIKEMSEHHKRACRLMSKPTAVIDENGIWTFGAPSVLYMFYRESGQLAQHVNHMIEAMPYYYEIASGHGNGAEHVMQAEWYYNQGDLENAEIVIHKGLYAAQSQNQTAIGICALFLQMRLALFKGDFSGVKELAQKLRADIIERRDYIFIHTLDLCEAFIYASLKQPDRVPLWLARGDFSSSRLFFPVMAFANIIYGRVLLLKGEYLKLLGIAGQFRGVASVFPNLLASIYTAIYTAAANERIYRRDEAMEALRQSLDIAIPDKVYMPFVENCDVIRPLLEDLHRRGSYSNDIAEILRLYESYQQSVEHIIREHFTTLQKPGLTEREKEIARLAAGGFTNKEIGQRLFISENTVKTQLKSIFDKLEINSRSLLKQYIEND